MTPRERQIARLESQLPCPVCSHGSSPLGSHLCHETRANQGPFFSAFKDLANGGFKAGKSQAALYAEFLSLAGDGDVYYRGEKVNGANVTETIVDDFRAFGPHATSAYYGHVETIPVK